MANTTPKIYVAGHRGMVGSASWTPEITAQEMCEEMVSNDLAQAKQHALLKRHGYQVNVSVE
jgi:hypothetical protein